MKLNLKMLSENADGKHRPLRRCLYRLNKVSDLDQHADYGRICQKTEPKIVKSSTKINK